MSLLKVSSSVPSTQVFQNSAPKPVSRKSWLLEAIRGIWKAFCDLLCCRKSNFKQKPVLLPKKIESISDVKPEPKLLRKEATPEHTKKPSVVSSEPKKGEPLNSAVDLTKTQAKVAQVQENSQDLCSCHHKKQEPTPSPFLPSSASLKSPRQTLPLSLAPILPKVIAPLLPKGIKQEPALIAPIHAPLPSSRIEPVVPKPVIVEVPATPAAKIEKPELKGDDLSANEIPIDTSLVKVTHQFSPERRGFLKVAIRGKAEGQPPAFVQTILEGNAHELLEELPTSMKDMKIWARGELRKLGECPCKTLSRIRNPYARRQFEDAVITYCSRQIPKKPDFHITHFASGHLFGSYVQVVCLVEELKAQGWRGKINWNFVDIAYGIPVIKKLKEDSPHTESIRSFCNLISKILPEGIEIDCNFFSSKEEYRISVSEIEEMPSPDCLIGMDLGNAKEDWVKLGVGGPYTFIALLESTGESDPKKGLVFVPQITFSKPGKKKFSYQPKENTEAAVDNVLNFI